MPCLNPARCKKIKIKSMKINQLFTEIVDTNLLLRLLKCYGLNSVDDKRTFCKSDLQKIGTVEKLIPVVEELRLYYLPCKAKVYLDAMDERKAVTVLKQVLRLHDVFLESKERNFNNRKVMFYTLVSDKDREQVNHMQQIQKDSVLMFV
jgi:hypothetical protein